MVGKGQMSFSRWGREGLLTGVAPEPVRPLRDVVQEQKWQGRTAGHRPPALPHSGAHGAWRQLGVLPPTPVHCAPTRPPPGCLA